MSKFVTLTISTFSTNFLTSYSIETVQMLVQASCVGSRYDSFRKTLETSWVSQHVSKQREVDFISCLCGSTTLYYFLM